MAMDPKLQQMLFETFKAELQEIHQSLITGLLALEKIQDLDELKATLKELFRYSHNIKGAAASASLPAIVATAHHLEDLFEKWRAKTHFPTQKEINSCLDLVDNFLIVMKAIETGEVGDFVTSNKGEKTIPKEEQSSISEVIKLPLSRIERASAKANEFIVHRLKLVNWFKAFEHSIKEINESEIKNLNAQWLKDVNDLVAESGQFLGEFSRAVQSLQEELKSMRMLPASTLLSPLTRTVRDVATILKKSVELEVYGGDIEFDKAILDVIKDPLQHLVRNAIDHGIEENEERKKLKKPIPAKLRIEVAQSAGKIILKIIDDGRGIDLKQIKQHAVSKGLYNEQEMTTFSDEQILDCIFASGFSLHKEVTEISGRGVGLDAVKNDLRKIKASIKVDTILGKGTTFTLTFPLTLATTRGVFFKLGDQTFMIPTLSLKALYALKTSDLKQVNNQQVFVINNKPIPLLSLNYVLTNEDLTLNPQQNGFGLLIESPGKELILWVDAIINEHDCVIKPLPPPFNQLAQYIGITLIGDSSLVLVLEPLKLLEMALDKSLSQSSSKPQEEEKEVLKKRVLIVDDSLTTRSLCANSLEAAGFETMTAIDGKKAWDLLQREKFDCIITDIVMPELDGFELTKLIKKNKKLAHIPVIIVSLLDSKKDKERGLKVGANAFLAKSQFDTHSLIETMGSLL